MDKQKKIKKVSSNNTIKTLKSPHVLSYLHSDDKGFDRIRQECLEKGVLFEDEDFLPIDTSVYVSCKPPYSFQWHRPHEIAGRFGMAPEMFANNTPKYNLVKGKLGDLWLWEAATCLFDNPDLLKQVVPPGQCFLSSWYAGVFHFNLWWGGAWQQVVIDDRLPTRRGQLVLIHSKEPQEFWGALLEKAYAKLCGSYEALKSLILPDALHHLTGGAVEHYSLSEQHLPLPSNIINSIFKAMERHSMILCAINPISVQSGITLKSGLTSGQVYALTDIREIRLISPGGDSPITLIRLFDPVGGRVRWAGAWGEDSEEWSSIPAFDRRSMGLVCREHGEFWMDFRDFVKVFDSIDLCHQLPHIVPLATPPSVWRSHTFHGSWTRGVNAGGRPVCSETHWLNPQYHLILNSPDEDENNQCTFLVELTQLNKHKHKLIGTRTVDIGFLIYKHHNKYSLPLPKNYFEENTFLERCDVYSNVRQIAKRFLLEVGEYVIVPTTYLANMQTDFMLRVLCEEENSVREVEVVQSSGDNAEMCLVPGKMSETDQEICQNYFWELTGKGHEMDVSQFCETLNNGIKKSSEDQHEISLDACKAIISVVNKSRGNNSLDCKEFLQISHLFKTWKSVFQQYGTSKGFLSSYSLKPALSSLGCDLSNYVLGHLIDEHCEEDLTMSLSHFIQCLAKIHIADNIFQEMNKDKAGKVELTFDQVAEYFL